MPAGAPVAAPALELSLVPRFELRTREGPVELPASAQRLIALLALYERPVARGVVAGTLWPDVSEHSAQASLRSALWRTRQPGVEPVEATTTSLRLAQGVLADVPRLMSAARRVAADLPVDDPAGLAAGFRDDLLPDWFDDWLIDWREQWRQLRLHALEALARQLAEAGAFGAAVEAALAAIRAEPLRESAHRTLIEVHCAEGNQSEALAQYEGFRALLERELHLRPSERMAALVLPLRRR
jgi:DNA-binding SARP family transcriptional activator